MTASDEAPRGKRRLTPGFWLALAALVVYAVSLFLPMTLLRNGDGMFTACWSALLSLRFSDPSWWVTSAAWLANPAIWAGIIASMFDRWRVGAVAAATAQLLAVPMMVYGWWALANHPGYWVWVGSAAVLLVGSLVIGDRRPAVAARRSRGVTPSRA